MINNVYNLEGHKPRHNTASVQINMVMKVISVVEGSVLVKNSCWSCLCLTEL